MTVQVKEMKTPQIHPVCECMATLTLESDAVVALNVSQTQRTGQKMSLPLLL